mgnify:CR=1 FL=1
MATKLICDRCGAEINPKSPVTYAGMRRFKRGENDNDYELCVSCAHKLWKWFTGEEGEDACLVACAALDKQIPRECVRAKSNPINYSACPICGERVSDNYCPNCGQAIDWGVDDL